MQEISASPRLAPEIDYWFYSTQQADGTYAGAEVIAAHRHDSTVCACRLLRMRAFLDLNGNQYLNWSVTGSWIQSTLNRGQLATRGASQSVSLEIAVPLSDLEFYKLSYRGEVYYPLFSDFTLHLRGELGYGDGYGDTSELPFYEHFFAGGFGSVRGYESNTLGPRRRHLPSTPLIQP